MAFSIHALGVTAVVALLLHASRPLAVPDPISVPPSRPLPAPIAAPLAPPINAPAAAPTAVPRAAVPTPLRMEARFGVVFICSVAYCWQEASSSRNSSKDLPEPGSAMMLGPLGMVAGGKQQDQ